MAVGPALAFQTGITGTSLNALTALLKEFYEPLLNTRLKNRDILLFRIIGPGNRQQEMFSGQRWYGAAITGWPESGGNRLEGVGLPFPYSSTAINPVLYKKDYYNRFRWTGQVERATKDKKGAWAQAVNLEIMNGKNRMREQISHNLFVGGTGILGQIDTNIDTTASTAMVMHSAATRSSTAPWRFGTQYIRPNTELRVTATVGGVVTIANEATGVQSNFRMATTAFTPLWTSTAATTSGNTTAGNDHISGVNQFLVRHNERNAALTTQSSGPFSGLMEIVDTSAVANNYASLYDLTRSTTPEMNCTRSENGGTVRPLTEATMQTVIDVAKNTGPGGEDDAVDVMIAHDSIRYRYANLLTATRQFMSTNGTNVVKGAGFKDDLVYVGGGDPIPFNTGKDIPPGNITGIVKKNFKWKYETEPGFLDTDGNVTRFIPDLDQTESIYHLDGNLYCEAPNANFDIADIAFSTTDYAAV